MSMYTGYIRKQEGTSMFNVHVCSFVSFGEKKKDITSHVF